MKKLQVAVAWATEGKISFQLASRFFDHFYKMTWKLYNIEKNFSCDCFVAIWTNNLVSIFLQTKPQCSLLIISVLWTFFFSSSSYFQWFFFCWVLHFHASHLLDLLKLFRVKIYSLIIYSWFVSIKQCTCANFVCFRVFFFFDLHHHHDTQIFQESATDQNNTVSIRYCNAVM